MPTVLVLTFDEALDSVTAENGKNYDIIDPNGHRDPIRRAVYDAATLTVSLNPKERISIHRPYQLIVNGAGRGAVSNMSGQPLDSVDAGQPGSSDHVVLDLAPARAGGRVKSVSDSIRARSQRPTSQDPFRYFIAKGRLGYRGGENGDGISTQTTH